jgi:hypothetical protein
VGALMSKDEEKTEETRREKGKATLMIEATAVAEEKAAKRRAEEHARDAQQDERTDKVYGLALEQAEGRATDLKDQLEATREAHTEVLSSRDKKDRYQWLAIGVLILAVIGLAGYRVAGNLFGVGEIGIGGDAPAQVAPKD